MSSWPGWPGASRHTSESGRSGSSRLSHAPRRARFCAGFSSSRSGRWRDPLQAGMRLALDDMHERRELALRQSVVLGLAGRVDQVFQAVGPAVNLAAGDLYRPQVLHDAHYGVEAVARHRVLMADVLPLLIVLPPVTKHGHSEIVHSFDLDHIEGREREEPGGGRSPAP